MARLYLTGVLIFGLLALLVALPAGVLAAYFGTRQLLSIFNIDYDSFHFSTQAIVWQVLAAILAPLLAALWPVLRGAAISVREALATYGLAAEFGPGEVAPHLETLANDKNGHVRAAAAKALRRIGREC